MRRTFLLILGFGAFVALSLAFTGNDTPVNNDGPYKNLKVLPKNITKVQLDSVMHHFTNSLNVKCNFCHVRDKTTNEWNYASDENKHKLVARDMMRMTDKINDKYFDLTGSKRDLSTPLM